MSRQWHDNFQIAKNLCKLHHPAQIFGLKAFSAGRHQILGHQGNHLLPIGRPHAPQYFGVDALAHMPVGQRQGAFDSGDRLRLATADDLPQIGQQQGAGRGRVNRGCQVVVHGRWGVTTWLAMLLDKHLFQAGGFDLLELLELDGVFGNQLVECAEVGADFLLFDQFRIINTN